MQAIIDSDTPLHSAISLCNITAGYEHQLFQNLSLEIPHGLFAGIVGPTACGKTTLLKILMGMHPVTCGKARLNGHAVEKIKPGIIGYVPQLGSVDWNFPVTVEEVIAMGLYTSGRILPWLTKHERQQIYDLAERLNINGCLKKHILAISGGQRQRTFLARALISNPKILILDEPTSGVDIKTQHEILHLLGSLNCEGITILLTTHDLNAVASHLPWVICFNKGVIAQGRPHDIFINEILTKTYGGDIVIVKHEGHLLIAHTTPLQFMDQS
ncbi:zinc/manganese transport system ATP-binding protein/zinc transport system ATP-binding protein [Nitrosomonas sp. PY1]|uniref:metal ABC transporter ATP-binding protein n=1 Tax=Nitrosomonas sp. PY1 TaxID=1803906 RepID=UPI001FC8A87C|nr:metal ABC transporter ATP-binding protein [Nitrosomonas sp. PY1]GKS69084.1 zinc/manganese transport system ATP-binding protein/zinc transport system ATP-binding protein [Nitrosomonas sp. PY1]